MEGDCSGTMSISIHVSWRNTGTTDDRLGIESHVSSPWLEVHHTKFLYQAKLAFWKYYSVFSFKSDKCCSLACTEEGKSHLYTRGCTNEVILTNKVLKRQYSFLPIKLLSSEMVCALFTLWKTEKQLWEMFCLSPPVLSLFTKCIIEYSQ